MATTTRAFARGRATAVLATALLATAPIPARAGDATACARDKINAAARSIQAAVDCHAAAARNGTPVDDGCVRRATERLFRAAQRADQRGPCPGDPSLLASIVAEDVFALAARVRDPGTCSARKLVAAGHDIVRRLRCRLHDPAGLPIDCFAQVDARFASAFARAERGGTCTGDLGTVESAAEDAATPIAAQILGAAPSTTSSTTTTLPGLCGNGIVDPGEQCDGQSFCDATCMFGPTACCVSFSTFPPACIDMLATRTNCIGCIGSGASCQLGTCGTNGCDPHPIEPVTVCCQGLGSCFTEVVRSIAELGSLYAEGCSFHDLGLGRCGTDRVCHPGG